MNARLERVNLLLLVPLISIVVALWAIPVFRQGLFSETASGFLFAAFMQPLYELLHQAMHGMFHRNKRVNDAAGAAIAAFLPSSFSLIQMVHIGHHVSNRSSRERIEYYADGASAWRQSVFYYAILLGLNWLGFVLQNIVFMLLPARTTKAHGIDRNFGATLPQLSIKKLAGMRLEFFCVLALHIALLTLTPVTLRQYAIFTAWNALFYSQIRYIYHYRSGFDFVEGAFDLKTPKIMRLFLLNSSLHLTHHRFPNVPWADLPARSKLEDQRFSWLHKFFEQWRGAWPESDQVERQGRHISWNGREPRKMDP